MNPFWPNGSLVPGVEADAPPAGSADDRVMPSSYRACVTNDPANRVPWPRPAGYDADQFELLVRLAQARPVWRRMWPLAAPCLPLSPLPLPSHRRTPTARSSTMLECTPTLATPRMLTAACGTTCAKTCVRCHIPCLVPCIVHATSVLLPLLLQGELSTDQPSAAYSTYVNAPRAVRDQIRAGVQVRVGGSMRGRGVQVRARSRSRLARLRPHVPARPSLPP